MTVCETAKLLNTHDNIKPHAFNLEHRNGSDAMFEQEDPPIRGRREHNSASR